MNFFIMLFKMYFLSPPFAFCYIFLRLKLQLPDLLNYIIFKFIMSIARYKEKEIKLKLMYKTLQ